VAAQDVLRIATWNAELSRKGPGVLLRDILSGDDDEVLAAIDHISKTTPDVLVLTGIDTDFEGHTAQALALALTQAGATYPYVFSRISNAGLSTGRDLDKDGRFGQARDGQSYGEFHGQGGLAVLSRLPIEADGIKDFSTLLWRDLPQARLPAEFYEAEDLDVLRLSSTNHWDVPVSWGQAPIHMLAFYATTPVFDGEEDRNGLRNADEIALWQYYLDGRLDAPAPDASFVVIGDANLDPHDGDGRIEAMQDLLADPRLQDTQPRSAHAQGIANDTHTGDAALDTADWDDPVPGNLRVDYVLPSADLKVIDSGVSWSSASNSDGALFRHGLVWVDIARQ
jgi:hypothetical protein